MRLSFEVVLGEGASRIDPSLDSIVDALDRPVGSIPKSAPLANDVQRAHMVEQRSNAPLFFCVVDDFPRDGIVKQRLVYVHTHLHKVHRDLI